LTNLITDHCIPDTRRNSTSHESKVKQWVMCNKIDEPHQAMSSNVELSTVHYISRICVWF
jgi:hypothetical protein